MPRRKYRINIEQETILWRDRKRFLGLPLSFTRYEITPTRLTIRVGFFNTSTEEILLFRVLDLQSKRTFWQKIFGVGTIFIYTMDQTAKIAEFRNIKGAEKVRQLLGKIVEAERERKRITAREMFASGFGDTDYTADLDGDGIPDYLQY
ncbi:MAG TPA: PH domain-containing protein [Clostridiaceae bacterium]|nr:PH domain-containing protein [Clostridiaceae bacterium]